MNVKEYISSGVLEAYALGALNDIECAEVEANMLQYPEIAAELYAVQQALQLHAESEPAQPPAFLKEKIWNSLQQNVQTEKAAAGNGKQNTPPQIVPFPGTKKQTGFSMQRAAIWVLLISSVVINLVLWSEMKQVVADKTAVNTRIDSLTSEKNTLAKIIEIYNKEKELVANPFMQTIVMQSTSPEHPMAATIYASKQNGDTYLSIQNLPMPPQGMQYQLWIIKDGKPVDMGVLPNEMVSNGGLQKINKQILGGQAYAISLEKEGGSPVPTMEKIFVMGKISS